MNVTLRTVVLSLGVLAGFAGNAADLSVSSPTHNVFGNAESKLEISLRNHGASAFKAELQYRVFQLSDRLYTPVSDGKKWISVNIPTKSTRHAEFSFRFPEVRAPVKFKIVWFDEGGKRLAAIDVTAHPKEHLKPLKDLLAKKLLGLWDPDETLLPVLATLEVTPQVMQSRWNAEDFRGETLIVVHSPKQRLRLDEKLAVFDKLNRNRVSVICLLDDSKAPLPLSAHGAGKANTVFADLNTVLKLERCDEQVRLLRLLEISRHPNPERILIRNEK